MIRMVIQRTPRPTRTRTQVEHTVKNSKAYVKFSMHSSLVSDIFFSTDTCPLCGLMFDYTDPKRGSGTWTLGCDAIDHDNVKGVFRGRICQSCNSREGQWKTKTADEMTSSYQDEPWMLIDWDGGWYKRCEKYRAQDPIGDLIRATKK